MAESLTNCGACNITIEDGAELSFIDIGDGNFVPAMGCELHLDRLIELVARGRRAEMTPFAGRQVA